MEPIDSLSYLQDPATSPYSEKDPVHAPPPLPTHFKSHYNHFYILAPSTPRSSK